MRCACVRFPYHVLLSSRTQGVAQLCSGSFHLVAAWPLLCLGLLTTVFEHLQGHCSTLNTSCSHCFSVQWSGHRELDRLAMAAERLAFMAEWLDPVSNVAWTYQMIVFPGTKEVELFDVKNRRTFLRKSKIEDMKPELFFVGGKVTIMGRQLDIKAYGDAHTKKVLDGAQQKCAAHTAAAVHPDLATSSQSVRSALTMPMLRAEVVY